MNSILEPLVSQLQQAEAKLQAQKPQGNLKWDYPQASVREIQSLANQITEHTNQNLEQLLHWPRTERPKVEDAQLFYEGHHEPRFNRTKDWFNKMGFTKYDTPYTFADNWDRQYISATFLVPDNIESGDTVPIIWYFHGGGLITGASDHIPWYSQSLLKHAYRRKAITIAPDYPLGPEANYHDIYNAVRDFLNFYTKDGCFVPGETRWTEWLKKEIGKQIVIDKEDILIDGESAGGHVAVTAIFMNASRDQGFGLRIKAAMLRYPMIKHYTRLMPNEFSFMGEVFTEEDMYGYAKQLKDEIEKLETLEIGSKIGFVRMRSKGCAPQYMWAAPLLSLTGEWKGLFQRVHGKTHTQQRNELWSWDCVERVSELHSQVTHGLLPAIIMHHGVDDANCPFKDTEEFKNRLHELYASRYPSLKSEDDKDTDERVHLIPVRELTEQDGVKGKHSAQVGHGYDYWQENESFQITCFKLVDKYWPKVS